MYGSQLSQNAQNLTGAQIAQTALQYQQPPKLDSEPTMESALKRLSDLASQLSVRAEAADRVVGHLSGRGQSGAVEGSPRPSPAGVIGRFYDLNETISRDLERLEVSLMELERLLAS